MAKSLNRILLLTIVALGAVACGVRDTADTFEGSVKVSAQGIPNSSVDACVIGGSTIRDGDIVTLRTDSTALDVRSHARSVGPCEYLVDFDNVPSNGVSYTVTLFPSTGSGSFTGSFSKDQIERGSAEVRIP